MTSAALGAWIVNAVFGVVVLTAWWRRGRHRLPLALVATHVTTTLVGLGLWVGFMASDRLALAWVSFLVMITGNGLGDAILTGRWRTASGAGTAGFRDYGRAVLHVLRGRWPTNATLHAFGAAVTFVLVLGTCVVESV